MNEINKKAVGERIKRIRLEMGYTTEEFGEKMKTKANRSLVSAWENGRYIPNAERLADIAFYGQISVDELLHGKRELTIDPKVLFNSDNDIRKYLIVDVDDRFLDMLEDDGISYRTIEDVLKFADIYVNMTALPEEITITKGV